MAIGYLEIDRKVEDAFEKLVTLRRAGTSIAATTIYKGFSGSELDTPRLEIVCSDCAAEMIGDLFTGNWMCRVSISLVVHYADKTRSEHTEMKRDLFDMICQNDIPGELNSSGIKRFWAHGGAEGLGKGWEIESMSSLVNGDHELKNELTGVLYCRPSVPE